MITLDNNHLPQTCLSYLGFRIALRETLERLTLAGQFSDYPGGRFGYLTEVPFLKNVAPHVQIDLLARTWNRHRSSDRFQADILDEAVVYAVCESAATLVQTAPSDVHRFLRGGPLTVNTRVDHHLASELRNYHLDLSGDGDFLLISQFEDLPPNEAKEVKSQFGLDAPRLEPLFDVLAKWTIAPDFQQNLTGLLTGTERGLLAPIDRLFARV